jgi:hypothetical protein
VPHLRAAVPGMVKRETDTATFRLWKEVMVEGTRRFCHLLLLG